MAPQRQRRPSGGNGQGSSAEQGGFGTASRSPAAQPSRPSASGSGRRGGRSASQVIPDQVANRMARRIALATGIPTLMGMGVFVASYVLVSRGILDIPPSATLLASGACFLLGLVGLSYGVLSSSWEEAPGSVLGGEQIGVNLGRIRASLRAMRSGGASSGGEGS